MTNNIGYFFLVFLRQGVGQLKRTKKIIFQNMEIDFFSFNQWKEKVQCIESLHNFYFFAQLTSSSSSRPSETEETCKHSGFTQRKGTANRN